MNHVTSLALHVMRSTVSALPRVAPHRPSPHFILAMAASGSASRSDRVQPIDADTAKGMVTEQMARVQNLAMEVIAKRSALEKTALRALRAKYPGTTTDELVRIWIDRLTQASHHPTSRMPWATMSRKWPPLPPTRSPTICSSWHRTSPPPTTTTALTARSAGLGSPTSGCWTLCRKGHQIGGGSTSAAATSVHRVRTTNWHPEHPTLSPALHRQPGAAVSIGRTDYDHQQRQPVANLDADYHQQPRSWVIAIDDGNTNQKRLRIEASKMRWVRHHVVTKAGNPKGSNQLDIETWYSICQKVPSGRRAPSAAGPGTSIGSKPPNRSPRRFGGQQGGAETAPPCSDPPYGGPIHRRHPRDHRGSARADDGSVSSVGREHLEVRHRSKLGSAFLL